VFSARSALGVSTIAYAVAFNIPFSMLAVSFDYPDVLRRPPGEVLEMFSAGGGALVLTWYGFTLIAALLLPLALALSLRSGWIKEYPGLSIGAAIAGALSSLAQAVGLSRWVFAVPALAGSYVDPAASDAAKQVAAGMFMTLNLYGGVAIGEHLGQLFLAFFIALTATMQLRSGQGVQAAIGFLAAIALIVGLGEGVAIALGHSGEPFGLVTIAGFMVLTVWLVATGLRDLGRAKPASDPHHAS
jgi:hypothetical protein